VNTQPNQQEILSSLLSSLLEKYTAEPKRFRAYLPEVAQILDTIRPQRHGLRDPFGLTEREQSQRLASLLKSLEAVEGDHSTKDEAIIALEDYAALSEDDNVPQDLSFERKLTLLKRVLEKSPGSFKSNTRYIIAKNAEGTVAKHVSILRGVVLELTWDTKLIAISISPQKFRERKRLMAFVGMGQDSATDVAERHDDYFVETLEHAST
jgi:hypothetical protein